MSDPASTTSGRPTTEVTASNLLQNLHSQGTLLADHTQQLSHAASMVHNLTVEQKSQSEALQQLSQQQTAILNQVSALSAQFATLGTPAPPANPPASINAASHQAPPLATPAKEPKLAGPKPYEGGFKEYRGFMLQCEFVFELQPSMFSTDASRVAYITTHTAGEALRWIQSYLTSNPTIKHNYARFEEEFRRVFDHPVDGLDAGSKLLNIKQGTRTVSAYAIEFRTLAASTGWEDSVLCCIFRGGLTEVMKDEMVRDRPADLNAMVTLATDIDQRLRDRRGAKALLQQDSHRTPKSDSASIRTSDPSSSNTTVGVEPMEVGRTRLTTTEKENRRRRGLCLYCGVDGHKREDCPKLPKD